MSSPYFCVVVTTVGQTSAQQQQQFFSLTQRSCVIGVWVRGAVRGCGLANRQRDDRRREFPLFLFFSFFILRLLLRRRFSSVVSPSKTLTRAERLPIAFFFISSFIATRNSQLATRKSLRRETGLFRFMSTPPGQSGEPSMVLVVVGQR